VETQRLAARLPKVGKVLAQAFPSLCPRCYYSTLVIQIDGMRCTNPSCGRDEEKLRPIRWEELKRFWEELKEYERR